VCWCVCVRVCVCVNTFWLLDDLLFSLLRYLHVHTCIYTYIYVSLCVCVCVCKHIATTRRPTPLNTLLCMTHWQESKPVSEGPAAKMFILSSWLKIPKSQLYCNTQQHTATYSTILQHVATYCNMWQHTATCGNILPRNTRTLPQYLTCPHAHARTHTHTHTHAQTL